ncbi:MAG: CotH kinase family protein [Bacteroidota bacterium]
MKFYLTSLLISISLILPAQVIINEYSAANMDDHLDNYLENEDWVELYNVGGQTIDLSGYFLSDNINNPDKWEFPAGISIGPGEHLLIYCSDRDEVNGSFIHAGFKLTQTKQEYVILSDQNQNLVDALQITSPNQMNHSTGRTIDGGPEWGIFTDPTPGDPNANSFVRYEEKPVFSSEAGFYDGSITIQISAAQGAEIRYTLDGSEPTSFSPLYTNPIMVDQTTVVKAQAYSNDQTVLPSFTEANTYFIDETHSVVVLSVAGTDLADLLGGIQTTPNGTPFEPRGSFEYFEDGELKDEAYGEYNKHGNDSWFYGQRGIDWITRDQMGYTSSLDHKIFPRKDRNRYQRLILKAAANDNVSFENGGAHIRDAYVHTLSQRANMEMDERTNRSCVIYLNGEYWGLYEIREKVDDPDFTNRYYNQGRKWLDYLKTWGGTQEEYGSRAEWDDLHNFIVNNDMSDPANYEQVTEQLNVLSLIDYMILNTHIVCMDWLNWNTSWWRGRNPDGEARKWRYSLWDLDASFGHYINYTNIPNTNADADPCFAENLPSDFEGHGAMVSALMANEEFHSLYVNRYADMNNSFFTCDYMYGLLDSMIADIAPEMQRQVDRWGSSVAEWQENVQRLKNFIGTRCTEINTGIEDCYDVEGPYPVTVNVEPANIPNKVQVNTFIPNSFPYIGDYFVGTTLNFTAVPASGWRFDHWEVDNNVFGPDQFAEVIALALADTTGDVVTAYFVPEVPCAPVFNFEFTKTLSSIEANWFGPPNFVSYEVGYRKTGSGEDWETISVTDPTHTFFGLEVCTEYDVRFRSICDFAVGDYVEFVEKTMCFTGSEEAVGGIYEMNVFPNPFNDRLTTDVILSNSTDLSIEVLSMNGQILIQQDYGYMSAGQHQIALEVSASWPSGLYMVRVVTAEGSSVQRVIKG